MGVIIYSVNLNISPKMSLLECDNDYVTELHAYDFIIKGFVIKKGGALFVPDPVYSS